MKRALFSLLVLAACNSEQTVTPPDPPLTLDAGNPAPAGPRRMAFHRNPLGDVLQADNLMVDGDFELTGRNDQAPWIAFDPNQGQVTLTYDTGGHCRSGVRCAVIAPPQILVGYMGSPLLGSMHVRAYAKLTSGSCPDLAILAFDFSNDTTGKGVSATSKTPGADGWCVYESDVDNLALEQPGLYVQPTKTTAILDDVTVLPQGEAPVHGITPPPATIDAETQARVKSVIAWVRAHRKYGRP